MLCAAVWVLVPASPLRAHDLAIDQLVLWPDPSTGILRGEITFDPELTRAKDAVPTGKDEVHVRALLADQLRVEVDGEELTTNFVIRELWVLGGATPGDLVVFTAMLPEGAEHLRVFAGGAFKALVVSVQSPTADGHSVAWSWLLRGNEWTPRYPLRHEAASAKAPESGWKKGGPELFTPPAGRDDLSSPNDVTADGGSSSIVPESSQGSLAVRFIGLGYSHILPDGIDHLLFVAGLVLGALGRIRHILISLTLFTLAHTLTLGLGQLSWLRVSPDIVEPLIALSICLVGVDNLRPSSDSLRRKRLRYLVIFGFGLVHGLGFASALADLPFGRGQLLVSLLSFNVGVELGQLTFVLVLLAATSWIKDQLALRRYVVLPGSIAIAGAGLAFAILRVFG